MKIQIMLVIEVSINVFILLGIVIISLAAGFLFRSGQIRSHKNKIVELETEMLNNHADILQLQKEKVILEQKIRESKIRVIPLNSSKESVESIASLESERQSRQAK